MSEQYNLHTQQYHILQMLCNLLEAANRADFVQCWVDLAPISAAIQMAKAAGFYVAVARDLYCGEFSAVAVWETDYDTMITRTVRGIDVFTGEQRTAAEQSSRPRTWVYCTHPNGTHGKITDEVGAPSQRLCFAGYKRG